MWSLSQRGTHTLADRRRRAGPWGRRPPEAWKTGLRRAHQAQGRKPIPHKRGALREEMRTDATPHRDEHQPGAEARH